MSCRKGGNSCDGWRQVLESLEFDADGGPTAYGSDVTPRPRSRSANNTRKAAGSTPAHAHFRYVLQRQVLPLYLSLVSLRINAT